MKTPGQRGYTLVEVIVALGIAGLLAMATVSMVATQNKALAHFTLRFEQLNLLVTATVQGSVCRSVLAAGGTPPLGACGAPATPAVIDVLDAAGARVDAGSAWRLRGECQAGFYALKIKAANPAKTDPLTNQALGASWLAPAAIRFGAGAWLAACP